MRIINTTPHEIRFAIPLDGCLTCGNELEGGICPRCGNIYNNKITTVPPCGTIINAKPVETPAGERYGATLVRTQFIADEVNQAALDRLEAEYPRGLIVGSIIAAQAFPGRVLGLTPAPGFERVPVAEKLMSATKFTVF